MALGNTTLWVSMRQVVLVFKKWEGEFRDIKAIILIMQFCLMIPQIKKTISHV